MGFSQVSSLWSFSIFALSSFPLFHLSFPLQLYTKSYYRMVAFDCPVSLVSSEFEERYSLLLKNVTSAHPFVISSSNCTREEERREEKKKEKRKKKEKDDLGAPLILLKWLYQDFSTKTLRYPVMISFS